MTSQRFPNSAAAIERMALEWAYNDEQPAGPLRRLAGRLILQAADVYYRRELVGIVSGQALLPPTAFDPNHVVLLIGTLGPGGSERQLVTTVLGLQRTGRERLAVIPRYLGEPWQRYFVPEVESAGIEVGALATGGGQPLPLAEPALGQFERKFGSLPRGLCEIREFAAEFVRRRPGVVHLWLDDVNCKAGLAAVAVGVPRIVMSARSVAPHHFVFYHQYMRAAYRLLVRSGRTTLLNNSCAGAADYTRWLHIRRSDIIVLPNGFCFDRLPEPGTRAEYRRSQRADLGWSDTTPVLGTISRFTEEKRPELWVETALRVAARRSEVRFLIAGDGPLRSALEARVARHGVAERFCFSGYQRDPISFLSAMDVVMLTSRKEGSPNVLVEAQALGIPVVSTDAGGARETFVPGETGILVEKADPDTLAEAVLSLLDDRDSRESLGRQGSRYVRDRFGVARMIRETRAVYGLPGSVDDPSGPVTAGDGLAGKPEGRP